MEPSQCVPKLWSIISILKHNTHAIHVRIMLKFQCLNIYNYRSNLWKNIGTNFLSLGASSYYHFSLFFAACNHSERRRERRNIWQKFGSFLLLLLLLLSSFYVPFSFSLPSVPPSLRFRCFGCKRSCLD